MQIKWLGEYPPVPSRRPPEERVPENKHEVRPRDRPKLRDCLVRWAGKWGADLLLVLGSVCVSAGVGWSYPPAGLIAAGAFLIAGGVLWARGGDGP